MIKFVVGAAVLSLAFGAAAAQTSNSLPSSKTYGDKDFSDVITSGFLPFTPEHVTAFLTKRSFQIIKPQGGASGEDIFLISSAPNGIPYVFKLSQCGQQGCLFLEMIAPVLDGVVKAPISETDRNDFNRLNPMVILTGEKEGRLAIRYKLPALQNCSIECQDSALNLFIGLVNFNYIAFDNMSKSLAEAIENDLPRPTLASIVSATAIGLTTSGHGALEAPRSVSGQVGAEFALDFLAYERSNAVTSSNFSNNESSYPALIRHPD